MLKHTRGSDFGVGSKVYSDETRLRITDKKIHVRSLTITERNLKTKQTIRTRKISKLTGLNMIKFYT